MSTKRKQTTLSIKSKLEVLEALKIKKAEDVAKDFNIGYSTVRKIRQKEQQLRAEALKTGNLDRKRKRESPNEEVADAVVTWFHQMKAQNAIINGPLMLKKSKQLAMTLGCKDFKPSHGWLERLKSRHNIKFMKVSGERVTTDQQDVDDWITNVLPRVIKGYDPENIFNADETALFYKATPSSTLGSQPTSRKIPKDRLTVLFLCNATGTEKKAYVVGKNKKSHCFNRTEPPLPYYNSKNAWMTRWIWSDIMQKFDHQLNRKIILFADNVTCHKMDIPLKNIKIIHFPLNTMSLIQPLDLGIIRAAKAHYRTQVMRKMLLAVESGVSVTEFAKSVNVLKALHMLKQAWFLVSSETIKRCFQKLHFYGKNNEVIKVVKTVSNNETTECSSTFEFRDIMQEGDFTTFVDCDKEAECFEEFSDIEICNMVKRKRMEEAKEIEQDKNGMEIVHELTKPVSVRDALFHLSMVRKYLEENFTDYNALYEIEEMIEKKAVSNCIQKKIADFFK